MESIFEKITTWGLQNPQWIYFIIIIGILIAGKLTLLFGVVLVANNIISWFDFLKFSFGAFFIASVVIYIISRHLRYTKFGWKLYRRIKSKKHVQLALYYLNKKTTIFFIISKFLPGFYIITLFVSGWLRIKFSKFISSCLTAITAWFCLTISIFFAVFFGFKHFNLGSALLDIIIFVGVIVLILVGMPLAARELTRKNFFSKNNKRNNN